MKIKLILAFCLIITKAAFAQRIDFRNDSLFVNNCFVNGNTKKSTLDSLLNSKGKQSSRKGKYKPGTTENTSLIIYTYKEKGMIFTKNDYNNDLSFSLKMRKNSNSGLDWNHLPTKVFKGKFYIDENCMNEFKTLNDLINLKNCNAECQIACNISYKKRKITVLTDAFTNVLTCVFIY